MNLVASNVLKKIIARNWKTVACTTGTLVTLIDGTAATADAIIANAPTDKYLYAVAAVISYAATIFGAVCIKKAYDLRDVETFPIYKSDRRFMYHMHSRPNKWTVQ